MGRGSQRSLGVEADFSNFQLDDTAPSAPWARLWQRVRRSPASESPAAATAADVPNVFLRQRHAQAPTTRSRVDRAMHLRVGLLAAAAGLALLPRFLLATAAALVLAIAVAVAAGRDAVRAGSQPPSLNVVTVLGALGAAATVASTNAWWPRSIVAAVLVVGALITAVSSLPGRPVPPPRR